MYAKRLPNGDEVVTYCVHGAGVHALFTKTIHPGDPDYGRFPPRPDLSTYEPRNGRPDEELPGWEEFKKILDSDEVE